MTSLHASIIRLFAAAWLVVAMVCGTSAVQANDITLRQQATLPATGPVLLKHIATLNGETAEKLGETVVGQLDKNSLTLSRQDVRGKLDAAGVNWGRLSLRGFVSCQITLQLPKQTAAGVEPATDAQASSTVIANPSQPVAHDSALTLRDRVVEAIVRHAGQGREDLRITFHARDTQTLAQSVLVDRWEIEPANAAKVGRVLLTIRRWQEDRVTQTYRIGVDVACRTLAVVAVRDVRRGEVFTAGDVEIQEVYLSELLRTPATDLQAVVGRVANSAVTKGQVVYASEAARPELVKRGDRLVVRCVVGGLVVKISARAIEGGAMDDVITVANVDSNERLRVRIVGTREALLVESSQAAGTQVAGRDARHD